MKGRKGRRGKVQYCTVQYRRLKEEGKGDGSMDAQKSKAAYRRNGGRGMLWGREKR